MKWQLPVTKKTNMEKKKKNNIQTRPIPFALGWGLVFTLAWAIVYLILDALQLGSNDLASDLIFALFIGGLMGMLMGTLQHLLLERWLGQDVKHWVRLTLVGSIAGWGLLILFLEYVEQNRLYHLPDSLPFLFLFVVPAVVQWVSLRNVVRLSSLWIGGNAVANFIFINVILSARYNETFGAVSLGALLSGVAMGIVMLALFQWNRAELDKHQTEFI